MNKFWGELYSENCQLFESSYRVQFIFMCHEKSVFQCKPTSSIELIIGRQGLGGPPTKAMLLWLGSYICLYQSIFLCLVEVFRPRFHSVWSRPLCNRLVKKINQGTDVLTHKHTELPASSFTIICSQAGMYEINYIDCRAVKHNHKVKIAESGQLAVGIHPFDCKYTFLSFLKMLIALTACMGREEVCEKVGPIVKWASHYY